MVRTKLFQISFIVIWFCLITAFAHESPAPIPIQCGLNDTTLQGEYVQFELMPFRLSSQKHFNLGWGQNHGDIEVFQSVDAVIKSGHELSNIQEV